MYTEASGGRAGKRAFLLSPFDTLPEPSCLRFFYHMYGVSIETLKVYIDSKERIRKDLWNEARDHGDQWLKAEVNLPSGTFRLVFEGTRGADHLGDIAIDDVTVGNGPCALKGI